MYKPQGFCSFTNGVLIFVSSLLCGVLVMIPAARAQFYSGAISSAMGGAGRAAADPGEAVLLNPASLPHIQRYTIAGHYGLGWHPTEGNDRGFALLIADGTPENLFPGAVTFSRRWRDFAQGVGSVMEQDLQIAAGGMLLSKLSFGISGHRQSWVPTSEWTGSPLNHEFTQTNGSLGIIATPAPWLGFGLVAKDVFPTGSDVPQGVRLVPTYSLGTHVIFHEIFRLRLDLERPDVDNPNKRTNVMAGLESFFLKEVAFRMGAQWRETADQTWATAGFGFRGPRLSMDYSFQRDVRVADGTRHLFDLWLPF
jgi:hypothetical protein